MKKSTFVIFLLVIFLSTAFFAGKYSERYISDRLSKNYIESRDEVFDTLDELFDDINFEEIEPELKKSMAKETKRFIAILETNNEEAKYLDQKREKWIDKLKRWLDGIENK